MTPLRKRLDVGYVSRAHGLKGEVGIKTYDPASTVLDEVERVALQLRSGEERTLIVESLRATPKELLICFEGVESREDSEPLVGATVSVSRDDLTPPDEGEFFQGDLVGLTALDEQGQVLGRVEEIWESGPVPNLVIRGAETKELIVPFAEEFVPHVDLEKGQLVVKPPEVME